MRGTQGLNPKLNLSVLEDVLRAPVEAPGSSWELLAAPGSSWEVLAAPGSSWEVLAAPGSSWELQCCYS